ncbi:efflux RND transporter permease subunit [Anaeromusa acidaminophila]|uniref:efflux RND transporter permease subunit n=1 Tax=Anaeromusa acidaminophila TaxID=81464 RepID=UPI000364D361|nr:efflux RND transporter permease subunit [Anaeromusa acidaminophila]
MIETFIRRPVFTTMLVLLLVVFGLSSYSGIGLDLYPDVEFPIVNVTVTYTGASPEEMETLVTKPIEDAVSSVSGIKTLSSISKTGTSQITLEFEFGTDPKMAANEVREKVAGVRKKLPDQIDEPVVQRFDISAQSIIYFSLASDERPRQEIRKLAVDIVKDELQRLDGVGDVNVFGSTLREIQLRIDPAKMEAYNITYQQLEDAVNAQNIDTPGGQVSAKSLELTVRTLGKYTSVEELRNLVLANRDGRLIRVGDVVEVVDSYAEERGFAHTNGKPSVMVAVQKQSGSNTVDVAERAKKAMKSMQERVLPKDINVTIVRDSSTYIRDNVEDVMVSLLFGGFLAVVITFLFLQNVRATLISAIAIPTSIIATFFLMKVMNFTLNNMSLMGLSLAVGILIDDAIVVIENIFRHMEEGKPPLQAAKEGTQEISLAVLATTLSILAVFVPVGSMGEVVGQFFKQFGLTVAFAVTFSLFVAFTLTPMLSAYWLKGHGGRESLPFIQKVLDVWEQSFLWLRDIYREVLRWALRRPKKLVAIAFLSLFINGLLLPFVGVEFQPSYDSGEFSINFSAPAGTSQDQMIELAQPLEKMVLELPELKSAFVVTAARRDPIYKGTIGVRLTPGSERNRTMDDIMNELRVKTRKIKGLKVAVVTNQGIGRGDSRPVQLGLRGPELEVLNQKAQELADMIRQLPGTADVDISSEQYEPQIHVKLDPAKAGSVGITAATAGDIIQTAFLGVVTKNQYNVGGNDYDIRLRLQEKRRVSYDDVANLRVSTAANGSFVRLADIATVKVSAGPTQIDRESRQRQVIVYANAVGVSAGEILNQVKALIPDLNLPLGYSYKFVGQADSMNSAFGQISKAILLAVILIYMVLAAEFESFVHPMTIMLSLPFSLVGAILSLMMTGKTINMISLIGAIMLMGLVTKNAILLIDYTNQLRREGWEIREALVEAGSVRLRPILMTTMAMIFGMLPVAMGIGAGAEMRSSMGVVLVGGLITSTVLTLVVVPLVYMLLEGLRSKKNQM